MIPQHCHNSNFYVTSSSSFIPIPNYLQINFVIQYKGVVTNHTLLLWFWGCPGLLLIRQVLSTEPSPLALKIKLFPTFSSELKKIATPGSAQGLPVLH